MMFSVIISIFYVFRDDLILLHFSGKYILFMRMQPVIHQLELYIA